MTSTRHGTSASHSPGSSARARRATNRKLEAAAFDLPTVHLGGDTDVDLRPAPTPPGLPEGRVVELPGRGRTWVHEAAGPPGAPTLLLLHGWTVTAGLNWFPSFPALARRFHVVALDHRGHGRGLRTGRRFRLEDCADDAAALADVLGIESFLAAGYSMGGPIAQLLWKQHPDRVDGLVLCATSRNFRGTPVERAMFSAFGGLSLAARLTPAQWRMGLNARMALRRYDDSELGHWARTEVARNDPRAVVEAVHALGRYSSHEWIGEVDVPTAVVVTEHDSVVPPERQRKLAESIPGTTVYSVTGDHGVCVMRPDKFLPKLMAACLDVSNRAGVRPPDGDGQP
jgi:3-oxoadipate enol-lactonase